MFELLKRLLIGHNHKWIRAETIAVQNPDGKSYLGQIVILRCETCGALKNHKINW